jgi:acetyl-CoA acyltransferase 1
MLRAGALAAGYPNTTTASTCNRFCSSSLTATQHIANEVATGLIEVGIAVGAETLSQGNVRLERPFVDEIMQASQDAADTMQPMGQTSENVAKDFGVTREMQDHYAVESYRRAEKAQKEGWFDDEIASITVKVKDKDGQESDVKVSKDDVRYGTTYEGISKLKPAFAEFGDTSHAGNSSQVTDGAAAIVLMKRSKAEELGVPVLAKYVDTALSGLAPRIMVNQSPVMRLLCC